MERTRFVYQTYIATTPEKVFAALMDSQLTRQYWGRKENVSDWKVGSTWAHQDVDDGEVFVRGEVLESDPPRRLVLTWVSAFAGHEESRVSFEIQPFMGAVKLTVTHDDLVEGSQMEKGVSAGWPAILSSLKSLLETGAPLEMTTRAWKGPPPA